MNYTGPVGPLVTAYNKSKSQSVAVHGNGHTFYNISFFATALVVCTTRVCIFPLYVYPFIHLSINVSDFAVTPVSTSIWLLDS